MTLLVTGGAGFLGSHVAEEALRQGRSVVVMDNFYPDGIRKKRNLTELSNIGKFLFFEGSAENKDVLKEVFREVKIDHICHLEGSEELQGDLGMDFEFCTRHIAGFLNILEAALHCSASLVFASSPAVYEQKKEDDLRPKEDDALANPGCMEGVLARSVEMFACLYHTEKGLNCTGLRVFSGYGRRAHSKNAVSSTVQSFLRGIPVEVPTPGFKMERDCAYVTDLARGILQAIDKEFGYEIFNLGAGFPVTLADVIERMEIISGKRVRLKKVKGDVVPVVSIIPDITKAKNMLGFKPTINLREGLGMMIKAGN